MIIQLHTKDGAIVIGSETVTDKTLTKLGINRERLVALAPRDLKAEIDDIRAELEVIKK